MSKCSECYVLARIEDGDTEAEYACESCGNFNEPTMADGVTPLQW